MSTPPPRVPCPKPDCNYFQDGQCVDAFPLAECPSLARALAALQSMSGLQGAPVDADQDANNSSPVQFVTLPESKQLGVDDVNRVLCCRPAVIVALMGAAKAGKTTLVAALYEEIRRRDFAGFSFKASDTVQGFEYRAFLSRMQSGRMRADTPRTTHGEGLHFLHLQMLGPAAGDANTTSRQAIDLLIADRAGESVALVLDTPDRFADFIETSHCSVLVLLVDGAALVSDSRQVGHIYDCRSMVRALKDNLMLRPSTRVQIVLTKLDDVQRGPAAAALQAFDGFVAFVRELVSGSVADISAYHVAARPEDSNLGPAHGLDELLRTWVMPPKLPHVDVREVPIATSTTSEFDLLLIRHFSAVRQ